MVVLVLLGAGATLLAVIVAVAAGLRGSRLALSVLGGLLVVIHSAVLLAGLAGHLTPGGVATLLGIGLAGAVWCGRGIRDTRPDRVARPRLTGLTLASPLAAIAAIVLWLRPHVFDPTRLWIWDDYTYHMVYPALWLREHAITAVAPAHAFTMQAWYLLSASVVATWFMVPFEESRGDALAWVSLTAPLYAGIVASGAAELLARLGCRRGAWAVPVILFVTSHRITVMASSFSDADLAHAAALFAAFVFAVPRGDGESREAIRVDAWYAALLAGIALGVKVTAAPTALIILLMMAMRAGTPGARLRAGRPVALIFAVAWVLTGGYWYVRNVVHTGNPLYPAAFLIWPGATFPQTTLREYAQHYGLGRAVGDALVVYLNWPRFHATLAVGGFMGLAGWLVVRRRLMTRSQGYFACGTLAVAVITLLLLPSTPFSAGNGMTFVSGFIHWDSMRYVALLAILGWVALGFLLDAGIAAPYRRTLAAGAVTAGALLASELAWIALLLILAAAIVGAVIIPRVPSGVLGRRTATAAWATAAVVVAGIAAWSHGAKATATAAAFHREPLFGGAAAVLDRQPAGTRVAIFGDQWVYPTFGARHRLDPVRLDGNGSVASQPIGDAMAPGPLTVHPWRFRSNLATARVGIVLVIHLPHPGRSPEWPPQAAALDAIGGTRLLYRDGTVGIWKLTE